MIALLVCIYDVLIMAVCYYCVRIL